MHLSKNFMILFFSDPIVKSFVDERNIAYSSIFLIENTKMTDGVSLFLTI